MNSETFWKIVDSAARASPIGYRQVKALRSELEQLSAEELVEFQDAFNTFFNKACTPDLWDAATIVLGECSGQKFEEFRGWLIQQGQDAFEAGTENPDDLGPYVKDTAESLRILSLAKEVHATKSKSTFSPKVARATNTFAALRTPREDLPAKYPQLNRAFPYLERSLSRAATARAAPLPMSMTPEMLEGPTLSREDFWRLIDECRPTLSYLDEERMVSSLKECLHKMPFSSVVSFQHHVDQLMAESYKANLWEVATIIMDGCSDDSFDYMRGWLIAMGHDVYSRILADPERTVDYFAAGDEPGCQAILTVAYQVFSQRTNGAQLPRAEIPEPKLDRRLASEKQLSKLYPAIWKRK